MACSFENYHAFRNKKGRPEAQCYVAMPMSQLLLSSMNSTTSNYSKITKIKAVVFRMMGSDMISWANSAKAKVRISS